MKYVKILGLAAVAAMALMAFVGAGTASAGGVLCSTTTNPCTSKWATGTVLDFSASESTKLVTTTGTVLDTCPVSTVKGTLTANPDANGEATGNNEVITWGTEATPCTHSTNTIVLGGLRVTQIAGTSNGDVFADKEIRVTISGLFPGENCVYGVAAGTTIGEIKEGNPASFVANAVASKTEPTGDFCPLGPSTSKWTGAYVLTSPSGTTLSVSSS